ncbi:peptide deformylase [Alistipes finegoldii]|uniref:peptide deformylase n=1 Tax=Alistipes finegoldii TaxID=214856 RepID=UPI000340E27F|nr:peptide deformylase 1 [Alistipes finegoldii CAG:68]
MKRLVIACACLLAACAVQKGFTDKECEVIASQSGAVMRLCRIGDRADSLFLRRKAAPLGAEELRSEYFRLLKQGMLLTVRDPADEGVGIAASQVGVSRRLIAVQRFDKPGEPFECYVNPEIVGRSAALTASVARRPLPPAGRGVSPSPKRRGRFCELTASCSAIWMKRPCGR